MRINALGNTATDFASDDYIAIDGSTNGSRKMKNDSLLNVTSQNALAGNVAQAFSTSSSYAFGDKVIVSGVLRRAKVNVSAGAYNASQWEAVTEQNKDVYSVNSGTLAYLNDLDSYPSSSAISCTNSSLVSSVAHKPVEEQFIVYTFATIVPLQIFVSASSGKIFFRRKWGTWSDWSEFVGDSVVGSSIAQNFNSSSTYKFGDRVLVNGVLKRAKANISAGAYNTSQWSNDDVFNTLIYSVNSSTLAYLGDVDDFPLNSAVNCTNASVASSVTHKPVEDQFIVYTFATISPLQIFVSRSGRFFFRRKWGTWSDWKELRFLDSEHVDTINPIAVFDNILCIGDSLTYSQVYTAANSQRQAKKPWPEILAHICNSEQVTMAVAGDTSIAAWTRWKNSIEAKTNAVAIVYLGTNGGLTDTLNTDAPADADPSTWDDTTNTGCYALIVNKLKQLGYKVILVKPWTTSTSTTETTGNVIAQIGVRFNCCVINAFHTTDLKYHYYPDLSGQNTVHYNDLGYAWFANALIYNVSIAEDNQMKYIIPS